MLCIPVCNSFLLSELGLTSRLLPEHLEESGVSNGTHSVIFSTSIKLNKLFYCAEPPPMLTVTLPDKILVTFKRKGRFSTADLPGIFYTCNSLPVLISVKLFSTTWFEIILKFTERSEIALTIMLKKDRKMTFTSYFPAL